MALTRSSMPSLPDEKNRGLWFPMKDGSKPIRVLATFDAIKGIKSPPPFANIFGVRDRFYECRERFEQIASKKFGERKLEDDGTVHITQADVP